MSEKIKIWLWLAGVNIFISSFTFGGGYIVVPMIRKYYVEQRQLFSEEELMEMSAIAQSTPGAIAINLSALAGYRVAKGMGVLISCTAAILPPLIILGIVATGYEAFASNRMIAALLQGMQAGVAALIVDLVIEMSRMIINEKSLYLTSMIPITFIANFFFQIPVSLLLFGCCFVVIIQVARSKGEGVR